MTREEALNILHNASVYHPGYLDALNMAIKVLEQEPCEDCISRQAAIDELYKMLHDCFGADDEELDAVITTLNELPPVTPAEKVGHWEWVRYDGNPNIGNWHCSECRTIIPHMPEEIDNTPIYKWCPMCGAKMQEVEE